MAKNKFPKSVSFNLNNPSDQLILAHVKRMNFSGYVKKLILSDIKSRNDNVNPPLKKEPTLSKLEQLKKELNNLTKDVSNDSKKSTNTETN